MSSFPWPGGAHRLAYPILCSLSATLYNTPTPQPSTAPPRLVSSRLVSPRHGLSIALHSLQVRRALPTLPALWPAPWPAAPNRRRVHVDLLAGSHRDDRDGGDDGGARRSSWAASAGHAARRGEWARPQPSPARPLPLPPRITSSP